MEKEQIDYLRKGLIEELTEFNGEPRIFGVRSKIMEEILFNTDEFGMKTFALPLELMKKVDFRGISFDNFFAYGFDFSLFKGISIDPQKVFDKDLSYANLNGVIITNTFDGVTVNGTEIEGMIYKTWKIKFKNLAKSK